MKIKIVSKQEINSVVKVHNESFQGFFLTELGNHFLKIYYESIRKNSKGILLGYFEGGQLYGFAAATTLSKGFNKNLIKSNWFPFSLIGMKLLVTRMHALIRLFKNFSKTSTSVTDNEDYAELLSIGVSNERQGMGIGKKLLIELEKKMQLEGCSKLSLTTDFHNNEKAVGFYKNLGYDIYYDFITYPNRKMYRMIKEINKI